MAESLTQENLDNLELTKAEYEREYDYIVRGSIICSHATWFEQQERNSKYFLNLESSNKKKSCMGKKPLIRISNSLQSASKPYAILDTSWNNLAAG